MAGCLIPHRHLDISAGLSSLRHAFDDSTHFSRKKLTLHELIHHPLTHGHLAEGAQPITEGIHVAVSERLRCDTSPGRLLTRARRRKRRTPFTLGAPPFRVNKSRQQHDQDTNDTSNIAAGPCPGGRATDGSAGPAQGCCMAAVGPGLRLDSLPYQPHRRSRGLHVLGP